MRPVTRSSASSMGRVCPTDKVIVSFEVTSANRDWHKPLGSELISQHLLHGSPRHNANDLFTIPGRATQIGERFDGRGIGAGDLLDERAAQRLPDRHPFCGSDFL